jgi:hypothetical protein
MRLSSDSKSATWGHLLRSEAVATQLLGELQIAGKLLDAAIRNQKGERADRYFKLAQSAWLQVSSELQDEDPNELRYAEVRAMLASLAEQLTEYSACFNTDSLAAD